MTTKALGEIIKAHGGLIQTGPFGSQLHQHEYTDEGVPVIMPKDIKGGRIDVDSVARISEQKAAILSRHMLRANTIVFPRRGDISKCALISEAEAGFICGTGCLKIEVPESVLNPKFFFYFLGLQHVVDWLEKNAVGTTMLNLNSAILGRIRIPDIPLATQEAIADILSAYDDLIENNRRRMALLEESARLLYREWFVQLRFPGHEHAPVKDGVPGGWERRTLGDCVTFLSGGTPNKGRDEFWSGDIPWVSSGEMTIPRIRETSLHITEVGAANGSRVVPPNTILAVVRGMSLAKEFRITITTGNVAFNQDLKALVAHEGIDPTYLFASLLDQRESIRERATEASHGTKKLDTPVLSAVAILLPSKRWQQSFREQVGPMNSQWDNLCAQNEKLKRARDLLLPRLMNGEIAV